MNRTIIGAILIFILIVAGAAAIKFIMPVVTSSRQKATSDAVKTRGKIRIDMDNWIGYFPLRSREMKNLMRRSGYIIECGQDNADYGKRMKRLAKGEIDFAVATVDSYLLNGAEEDYPGTIVMVIDESKGGDAILARKERITSLDQLRDIDQVKVAFTPDSPSHHLARAASDHFGLTDFPPSKGYGIETGGSQEACDRLLAGTADVAVCWEPDVSRAMSSGGVVKLLGTEDTHRLIVDILVVNRKFAQKHPDRVTLILEAFFTVLKKYSEDPALLKKHVIAETGLGQKSVQSMLKGVQWVNFTDNCASWFGISPPGETAEQGLIETMDSTVEILINAGEFTTNPIPDNDPYRLTNSTFLESVFKKRYADLATEEKKVTSIRNTLSAPFSALNARQWAALRQVGTLKIQPISFQRGSAEVDMLGRAVLDRMSEKLKHYPNFRIMIKAHTGVQGDEKANLELSRQRAQSVRNYLVQTYAMDTNRIFAAGLGGTEPLIRRQDESRRAWMYRLPRVEVTLAKEVY